jgi:hypothetical protein
VNYVLYYKIPYYSGTLIYDSMGIQLVLIDFFKFLSKYIMYVLTDCIFWADHISLYEVDLIYIL